MIRTARFALVAISALFCFAGAPPHAGNSGNDLVTEVRDVFVVIGGAPGAGAPELVRAVDHVLGGRLMALTPGLLQPAERAPANVAPGGETIPLEPGGAKVPGPGRRVDPGGEIIPPPPPGEPRADTIYNAAEGSDMLPVLLRGEASPLPMDALVLVVDATRPAREAATSAALARQAGTDKAVVFVNNAEQVSNEELDLVEMEIRELLGFYEFDGDNTPIISGSALKALNDDPEAVASIRELQDAVDTWVGTPTREIDKPFLMPVEDVFENRGGSGSTFSGRGTVVTGTIEQGTARAANTLQSIGSAAFETLQEAGTVAAGAFGGAPAASAVSSLRSLGSSAIGSSSGGNGIAVTLRGIEKTDIRRGMTITAGNEHDPMSFRAVVTDVYGVPGLGAIVYADHEEGLMVKKGDRVALVGFGSFSVSKQATVVSADNARKILDRGEAGDNVGLLLRGNSARSIEPGDLLVERGSYAPADAFGAELTLLPAAEAERYAERLPFCDDSVYLTTTRAHTTDVTGEIMLEEGREIIAGPASSGELSTRPAPLDVIVILEHPVPMEPGDLIITCSIREGGRTVGAGQITRIIN